MKKVMSNTILILLLGLIIINPLVVHAKKKGTITAESFDYDKKGDFLIAKGNPKIEYKDYIITADLIKYYQEDKKAIMTGNVVVHQNETKITGNKIVGHLQDDRFIIDGNVYIYYPREDDEKKKKEDNKGKEAKKDIIEIKAEHVDYETGEYDSMIATGNVVMDVEDRTIKSEYLNYNGQEEVVIARENVEVTGEDEEVINSDEFTLYLEGENEGFEAKGQAKMEFTIDDDEDDEENKDTKEDNISEDEKKETE